MRYCKAMEHDQAYIDQTILARTKLWTPDLDKLLRKWNKLISIRIQGHKEIERKHTKYHYMIGIPSTVISAIVAFASFSTFEDCKDEDKSCDKDQWIRLAIAIVSAISIVLNSLMTFLNYAESANNHKTAADDYNSLSGSIQNTLIIPGPIRGDPVITLQTIRSKYDDIVKKSPSLSSEHDRELSYTTIMESYKFSPRRRTMVNQRDFYEPQARSIRNDRSIRDREIQMNINVMNDIDNDDFHNDITNDRGSSTSNEELEEILNDKNDFDSEDEDKEVCIGFDLDSVASSVCSTNIGSPTESSAFIKQQQERVLNNNALINALEQELRNRSQSHSTTPSPPQQIINNVSSSSERWEEDGYIPPRRNTEEYQENEVRKIEIKVDTL